MKKAIAILLLLGLAACTDPRAAQKALDDMGFSDVQAGGYDFFTCGDDYTFHTKFTAKNPKGKTVTGVVCSGWLKGSSVKFD